MKSRNEILKLFSENREFLKENFHIVRVCISDFYACGDNESGSDIDLLQIGFRILVLL